MRTDLCSEAVLAVGGGAAGRDSDEGGLGRGGGVRLVHTVWRGGRDVREGWEGC